MTTKIFIDPGHGGTDPGAVGNGLKEKDLTLKISRRINEILLSEYEDVQTMLSRDDDRDLTLNKRTDMANKWKADYLLSVHINAGGGRGFEAFTYNGMYKAKPVTNHKRDIIYEEVMRATIFMGRGKKEQNFHMVRESNMQAVLTESGFIDNVHDAALLRDSDYIYKIARGHVNGLEFALGLKKKTKTASQSTSNKDNALYYVQVGAFTNKTYAEKLAKELQSKGYTAIIK